MRRDMNASLTRRQGSWEKMRNSQVKWTPYLFILPNMALFLVFVIIPVLRTFWISLHHWDALFPPIFIGFGNYTRAFNTGLFWQVLRNTTYYVLGFVPLQTISALILALLLNQNLRMKTFFRATCFFPAVLSMVSVALVWQWMFSSNYGIINHLIGLLGLEPVNWLADSRWAMPVIILLSVWKWAGYNMVIFLAGLQSIPDALYEAASIDGASRLQRLFSITLPLLRPTTLFVLIMSVIGSFQVFEQVFVMTRGGPGNATMTIVQYIYRESFERFDMGYGSAVTYVLFGIIFILTALQLKFFGNRIEY
jgi:multiple sugar transport system permease protein